MDIEQAEKILITNPCGDGDGCWECPSCADSTRKAAHVAIADKNERIAELETLHVDATISWEQRISNLHTYYSQPAFYCLQQI